MEIPGTDPDREGLTLIETRQGEYFLHQDGAYFRMYLFIEDNNTFDVARTEHQALEAGKMFGKFQELVSDLPGKPLYETIKNFHNVNYRLERLSNAFESDPCNRADNVKNEMDIVMARMNEMKILLDLSEKGIIPTRVTHNDTKFNNVLLDKDDNGLCVIDLDTVMPGLVHYDFGDAIRTVASTSAEDEPDLDKIEMNIDLFEAFTRGFLCEMNGLSEVEIFYLPLSARLLTYIIGVRFLTDYLEGDQYFKTRHKKHNLIRARAQFKLLQSMERQQDRMTEIVNHCRLRILQQ
jgi:Ser/Thr protein kinase RdoA (MazF antagonist)